MKLTELVGKKAIRTAPIKRQEIIGNNMTIGFNSGQRVVEMDNTAYCDDFIIVLAASETNAIIQVNSIFGDKPYQKTLGPEFCDDNWTDYDQLLEQAEETKKLLGITNEEEN